MKAYKNFHKHEQACSITSIMFSCCSQWRRVAWWCHSCDWYVTYDVAHAKARVVSFTRGECESLLACLYKPMASSVNDVHVDSSQKGLITSGQWWTVDSGGFTQGCASGQHLCQDQSQGQGQWPLRPRSKPQIFVLEVEDDPRGPYPWIYANMSFTLGQHIIKTLSTPLKLS